MKSAQNIVGVNLAGSDHRTGNVSACHLRRTNAPWKAMKHYALQSGSTGSLGCTDNDLKRKSLNKCGPAELSSVGGA
jgi:hypothetical protein